MKNMKFYLLFAGLLLALLAGCGGGDTPATEDPAPKAEAETEAKAAGSYSFSEQRSDRPVSVEYTVALKADGSFEIAESDPISGDTVYSGSSYEWRDAYFTTGPVESGKLPSAEWFNGDGSCLWVITGENQVQPMAYVEPESGRITSYKNIAYASNSAAQVLDIYLPEDEGIYPVIVVFHGGGFKFGDQNMGIIQPIFKATERGYAVVSADYRKSGEATFPAALADAKAAVRWVRANAELYGFDGDNIAVWGESAGAYLALMTALTPDVDSLNGDVQDNPGQSSAVKALIDFYGPVDFLRLDEDAAAVGMSQSFSQAGSFESDFLGKALTEDEAFTKSTWWGSYTDMLPAEGISAWIQVGDADKRVPYLQSRSFAEELEGLLGADKVKLGIIEGADHEDAAFYTEENLNAVLSFLDGILKE